MRNTENKISELEDELERLQNTVAELKRRVEETNEDGPVILRVETDQFRTFSFTSAKYPILQEIRTKEVIRHILNHLGLEFAYIPGIPSKIESHRRVRKVTRKKKGEIR